LVKRYSRNKSVEGECVEELPYLEFYQIEQKFGEVGININ